MAHAVLVEALSNRLRIQRELADHPSIRELPVRRPLIVVGPPRTGTTLLYHLLAKDPGARPLLTWEANFPAPLIRKKKRGRDRRIVITAIKEWILNRTAPNFGSLHPLAWDGPEECHVLTSHTFVAANGMMLETYREWYWALPEKVLDDTYAQYRLMLQMLHHQHPAEDHWVLKSPVHSWGLRSLMRAVPEATIILTHRHMLEVVPSFCSLMAVLAGAFTNAIQPKSMGPRAVVIGQAAIQRMNKAREECDPARIVDMPYEELVADPIAAVRRIYDHCGYSFSSAFEGKLTAYVAENKRDNVQKHRYTLEQFGLDEVTVNEAFAAYHQQHGLV
jgi:hypothetical protein